MSNITASVKVNMADAYVRESVTLTSGMVGARLNVEFSEDWDGLGVTAVFTAGSTSKSVVKGGTYWPEDESCLIPHECLVTATKTLIVGFYGTDSNNNIVTPTIYTSLGVILNGTTIAGTPTVPETQSLYNQVSTLLTAVQTELTNVKETAIKSANATVGTGTGTPSVSLTLDWIDASNHSLGKKATFAFNNLKGVGVSSIVFNNDGDLTISLTDGTSETFSGIKTALSTVTSTITSMSTVQSTWASSESARQSAEALRVSSESLRVSSETARASAELTRSASESARIVAESTRASNEVVRSNNETSRVASMSTWTSEQSVWTSEETVRSQAEVSRNSNEVIRNSNELVREENKIVAANATVDANTGTPSVVVTMTPHTGGGKDLSFAFHNLKGESGGGGGGTSDFDSLTNRPKYNGATMTHSTDIPEVKTATWDAKADVSAIPTKTSDLTNDSGFLTEHQSLVGYATQAWVNAQGFITSLVGYATEAWVNAQGFLKEHQSLSAYRTASAQDVIDSGKQAKIDSSNKLSDTLVSHGSTTVNAELSAHSSQIVLLSNDISDAWNSATTYTVGQYCISGNQLYKCKVQHSNVQPPNATYWNSVVLSNEIQPITYDYNSINTSIVEEYSSNLFKNGDVCYLNIGLRIKSSITGSIYTTVATLPQELTINSIKGMYILGITGALTNTGILYIGNNGVLQVYPFTTIASGWIFGTFIFKK